MSWPDAWSLSLSLVIVLIGSAFAWRSTRLGLRAQRLRKTGRVRRPPLSYGEVGLGLETLVARLRAEYLPDCLVGINRGGAIVGGLLAKRLQDQLPADRKQCYPIYIGFDLDEPVDHRFDHQLFQARRILLIDDAFRTGSHMTTARCFLGTKYPEAEVRSAVLLRYRLPRVGVEQSAVEPPDFCPFSTHDNKVDLPWNV